MKQKLIVLSADGMTYEDVEQIKTMPNYQKYLAGGARVKRVRSIYPTITFPCHTTMCTGVWPEKHGVLSNYPLTPGTPHSSLPWKWDYKWRAKWEEDIFRAAKRAGLTTAASFWPVSGNHPYIDYLMAEYWPQPGDTSMGEVYKRAGSSKEMQDIIEEKSKYHTLGSHPATEEYAMAVFCEVIKRYQPDLLMMHTGDIDGNRHAYGLFNDRVTKGIEDTDRYIGLLMSAVEEAGLLDCTNFVLTSDHGLLNIERTVSPNVKFAEAGLIDVDENGNLVDWKAYCMSGGTSALVYLKDPDDKEVYEKTWKLLKEMADEEVYGFTEIFTEAEIREREHLGGEFAFALETDGFTSFGDDLVRPLMRIPDCRDYRYGKATHGHLPTKGMCPVFSAKGPAFKENVTIETANLIDHAPTFAKVLGVELKGADGRVLEELLR